MRQVQLGFFVVAMFSLTTIVGCAAATPGDDSEGVGESQDHLLAGRRLSEKEAAGLIRQAGFPESSVGKMLCTIKYESNFYERASNRNKNGSVDYGLFQVNSIHLGGSGCPSSSSSLYTASTNTKCALSIYKSQGINAWYGYQKHRSECDRYPAPSSAAAPAPAPAADDDPDPSTSSSSSSGSSSSGTDSSSDGSCYSGTLEEIEPANTCVESKFGSGGWFQCHDGKWFAGGEGGSGPYGTCTSSHPLP